MRSRKGDEWDDLVILSEREREEQRWRELRLSGFRETDCDRSCR